MTLSVSLPIDRRRAPAVAAVMLAAAMAVVIWGGYSRGWSWPGMSRPPLWWRAIGLLQWLLTLVALGGIGWLIVGYVLKLLALPLSLATLPLWL